MASPGVGIKAASTLTSMGVSTGLLQKVWKDNQLYMESLLHDPIFSDEGLIKPLTVGKGKNAISMPKSELIIDCTPGDTKGKSARQVELIFLKSLDTLPAEGNAVNVLGSDTYTNTLSLKYTSAYANDWGTGVSEDLYGIDFRELAAYGASDKIRELLAQWLGELRGYYARYAYIHGHSPNLEAAPISLASSDLNRNFFCLGLALASQPAFSTTDATWADRIGDAAVAADDAQDNVSTIPNLLVYIDWLRTTKYLEPGSFGGMSNVYLQLLSTDQFRILRDPSVDNSFGRYWRDVASTEDMNKVVPGVAKVVIAEDMVCVRDDRAPTMTLAGGGSSDYTSSFGFMKCGRNDTRTTSRGTDGSSLYFDANITMGKGSLLKYEPEAPHYEDQLDNANKNKLNGFFGAVGYMTPVWDADSAPTANGQQESSCVMLTPRI